MGKQTEWTDSSTEMLGHISADCDMTEPTDNSFLPESPQPQFLAMNV